MIIVFQSVGAASMRREGGVDCADLRSSTMPAFTRGTCSLGQAPKVSRLGEDGPPSQRSEYFVSPRRAVTARCCGSEGRPGPRPLNVASEARHPMPYLSGCLRVGPGFAEDEGGPP